MSQSTPTRLIERVEPNSQRDLRLTGIDPNHWYPLARSDDLKRGKTIGVAFAGDPIALVRTQTGSAFALEDRCAHRQVPLHDGVVQGEELRCCYHGWTYDARGACTNVPYLAKGERRPNGVRSYPCRERYGFIFVYPGDPARLSAASFPEIPSHGSPRYKTRTLDRRVRCHYSFMHENLMDMNHQFLHRRLMGRIRTAFLDLRRTEAGVEVDYTFSRSVGRDPIGERLMVGKRPAPTAARPRDLMTIATNYPYQTLRFWRAGTEEPALDLWNVYVPVDGAQRHNHTFGLMMVRRPSTPGLIHLLWPFITWFTEGIFAEDRRIVEEEQKAVDRQGADWNQEVFPAIQALKDLLTERGVPLSEADESKPGRPAAAAQARAASFFRPDIERQ